MELLTLDEIQILEKYGCHNLQFTRIRLRWVGLLAVNEDYRKAIFALCEKLNTEDYESIYTDMYEDIMMDYEARKAARDQYQAVFNDNTGYEAECLLRI